MKFLATTLRQIGRYSVGHYVGFNFVSAFTKYKVLSSFANLLFQDDVVITSGEKGTTQLPKQTNYQDVCICTF